MSKEYRNNIHFPTKIAFLGNSVTAQRIGYRSHFCDLLSQENEAVKYVNAGIGGVGSLACLFLMDQFVLTHKPDFCFIECYVADWGSATPIHQVGPAIEAIILKLLNQGIQPCFLNFFRIDIPENESLKVIYENLARHYGIPLISINEGNVKQLDEHILEISSLFTDGIHTSDLGSTVFGNSIFSFFKTLKFDCNSLKNYSLPFFSEQIIHSILKPIQQEMLIGLTELRYGRFKLILPYLVLDTLQEIRFSPSNFQLFGILVVVDEASGVLDFSTKQQTVSIQLYDQWANQARIQAVLFDAIPLNEVWSLKLSDNTVGERGANGTPNFHSKVGTSLKIIGLMVGTLQSTVSN